MEDGGSNIGAGTHESHRHVVVLVPDEDLALRQTGLALTQFLNALRRDAHAPGHGPYLKKQVDEFSYLDLIIFSMFRKKKKLEFFSIITRISALMKADEKNTGIACRRLVFPSLCPTGL